MARIALSVVLGPVIVLVVLFGAMAVIGTEPRGTTAQDGDADRVTALETRVADLTEDLTSIREDFADQLLPEPRPASDFGASKFNVGSLSDDAIVLRCSTGTWAETYLDLLCDQIATP